MPEKHGRAVVVVMRVGREGEDQAIDAGCGDADGETGVGAAAGEVHDAAGNVAMEVEVQGVCEGGGGPGEGAHLSD